MELSDKIKRIRNRLNISQKEAAINMRCHASFLSELEHGKRDISTDVLKRLKSALGITSVPLTYDELHDFEKELQNWCKLINSGKIDEASALLEDLAWRAELSFDRNVQVLFRLVSAAFFRYTGNPQKAHDAIEYVSGMKNSLPKDLLLRYYIVRGSNEIYNQNYNAALKDLMVAENLNKSLNIATSAFYFNIAICLTNLDFSRRSMRYLEKVRLFSAETISPETDSVDFDICLSINYRNLNMLDRAQDLLEKSLQRSVLKQDSNEIMSRIYHNIGCVHAKRGAHKEAMFYFDLAIGSCGKSDPAYGKNLYQKAKIYLDSDEPASGNNCIDEGLELSENDPLMSLLFNCLKHSLTLDKDESQGFLTKTAIPKLAEIGQYLTAIEYCFLLKEYYNKKRRYKLALKYADLAIEYRRIIDEEN